MGDLDWRAITAISILGVLGLLSLFFPKNLAEEDPEGGMLRYIQMVTAGFIGIFPEASRLWIARAIGLIMCVSAAVILNNNYTQIKKDDPYKPTEFAVEVAGKIKERTQDYPARPSQNQVYVKDPDSGRELTFDLDRLSMEDVGLRDSSDKMADKILDQAGEKFGKPIARAVTPRRPPPAVAAPAKPAGPGPKPPVAGAGMAAKVNAAEVKMPEPEATKEALSPLDAIRDKHLKEADEFIKQAREAWNKGDFEASIKAGEQALELRQEHLEPKDPLIATTEKMIEAAKERAKEGKGAQK